MSLVKPTIPFGARQHCCPICEKPYVCQIPRCDRPDSCICIPCMLSPNPAVQERITIYAEQHNPEQRNGAPIPTVAIPFPAYPFA